MCFTFSGKSNHLIGGYISYKCVGTNVYEIKLTNFRDCATGNLSFVGRANVTIYDGASNLIKELSIKRGPSINVPDEFTNHPCATAPSILCSQYAEYVGKVLLPPIPEGYVITWQVCCRNTSIDNVNGPQNFGNTFTINIPPNDTLCNSSPHLNSIIPNVVCINDPLYFQIEATDQDGDSLVYELCEVLAGGGNTGVTNTCPQPALIPSPACPPPYNTVPLNPPFSFHDPIPAAPPLQLNILNGILTGTPNQFGTYIVGICISDYRDGVLLSTLRIDYKFTITDCIFTKSDMITPAEDPNMLCNGLTVDFTSECVNTSEFFWDFGDSTSTTDTSSMKDISYTFPKEGLYTVMLIAEPNDPKCSDTIWVDFPVRAEVIPNFFWSGQTCFEDNDVEFGINGYYPSDVTFEWDFGPYANHPLVGKKDPPNITWSRAGSFPVNLTVQYGLCKREVTKIVTIKDLSSNLEAGQDQYIYKDEWVNLEATGAHRYYWFAERPMEFSSRVTANTRIKVEEVDTIKFYVKGWSLEGCTAIDSVLVFVIPGDGEGPINFFSPNGDGINDVFDLDDINKNQCSISILNRWGNEVWSAEKYNNDWKGISFGGDELPDGTYYYILYCGNEVKYKSAITLMRETN